MANEAVEPSFEPSSFRSSKPKQDEQMFLLSPSDTNAIRPAKAGWANPIESVMVGVSCVVGFGNIWRFPYIFYRNGGAAFLIPYITMYILLGIPLFFVELSFGQFASLGPLSIWTINPLLKGIGYAMVAVTFLISLYYNVIVSYCMIYLVSSFSQVLPWASCSNWWNTYNCRDSADPLHAAQWLQENPQPWANFTPQAEFALVGTELEEFYYNYVLHQSPFGINDKGEPQWRLVVCLLVVWTVVFLCLIKGSKSLGKVAYVTALLPFALLLTLLVRGVTLPGAERGIAAFFEPKWHRLLELNTWYTAGYQVVFNLSCGSGCLVMIGSYNKFKNNTLRDATLIVAANIAMNILAGIVVFSFFGFIAFEKYIAFDRAVSAGSSLSFISMPEAFSKIPLGSLWSAIFFLLLITLGLGSQLTLVETVLTAFQEEFHDVLNRTSRKIGYRLGFCLGCFALGLPLICRNGIYIVSLVDAYGTLFAAHVICLLEVIALAWIYGFPHFRADDDWSMMLGRRLPLIFRIIVRFVTPSILLVLLIGSILDYVAPVQSIGQHQFPYPMWATVLGWVIAIFPIALVPIWKLYYIFFLGGFKHIGSHLKPMPNWGPFILSDRTGRYHA